MNEWLPPVRPAELSETRLIDAILDGRFPIDSALPPERELAELLGVTRPTLRETLQRLARDGWLEIHHGRATRVRNYWVEGNLAVLAALARRSDHLPPHFVPQLLTVRLLLAPTYTRQAVERDPALVTTLLDDYAQLPDEAGIFARADWRLHHALTAASGNPVFTLILNGFEQLYRLMGAQYFDNPHTRSHSRAFYDQLLAAARANDPARAEELTRQVMAESLRFWQEVVRAA